MNAKVLAIIAIFINNIRICQSRKYDNYTLYNTVPTEADHLKFLQNLDKQKYIDMVFWKKPYKLYEDVQFIVNPADKDLFLERANHFKLKTEVMLHDIGRAFKQQEVRKYFRLRSDMFSWENYHSLEDIYQWLADVAVKYPNIVELVSIGKSAEGREIYAMSLKKKGTKYKVIVEGGIHGNEWIAVEFVTYLVQQLVDHNNTKNTKLLELGRKYDWYIIPILNPDGFVYSQKTDRLWRKNRRTIENGFGVDLNRNFDYNFGKYGTSEDVKDDYYCGPHPFSEPETRALSEFISQNKHNLRFYFSFHAYGQKVIIPFADRIKHIENYAEMENYGKQAILKMYKMNRVKYSVGTTYDTLGLRISGNSASWVKKAHGVRYVFTFLLRDNGSYGYALPPSQIQPTCEETIGGLTELMTARPRRVRLNLFNSAPKLKGSFSILFCTVYMLI
ncbi:carboxypeptidase O-like [Trichoplusia ni]|uniref:Carboxypeptidase O-like n=1 Tax=Trichoplusia ni TaxID=7111 RepID=A0A7E5WQC6_TRINI|nr:carboxypeptidase O-like [Trichoplusia ni]